jgi:hypothetical protein
LTRIVVLVNLELHLFASSFVLDWLVLPASQ